MVVFCGAICLLLEALAPSHSLMGLKNGWWKSKRNEEEEGIAVCTAERVKAGLCLGARRPRLGYSEALYVGRLSRAAGVPFGWRRQDPSPFHSPDALLLFMQMRACHDFTLGLCWYLFSFLMQLNFRSLYQCFINVCAFIPFPTIQFTKKEVI